MPSINRPQDRDYPTLCEKFMGPFKSPDRTSSEHTNGLTSLSADCVVQLKRSPKVQHLTRPGIEPGTFWLAVSKFYRLR